MSGENWIILAVRYGKNGSISPVQLQKSLFLLGKKCPNEVGNDFYTFEPYDYGPFNKDIYHDAEELSQQGLLAKQQMGPTWAGYSITPEGIKCANRLDKEADPAAKEHLGQVVEWAQGLTFPQLLSAIYQAFPEFKKNSVFQD